MGASPHRQRGMAMLIAILLVALGTMVAVAVAYESAMSARRGAATLSFDEALLVGEGAEALAAYGLKAIMDQSGAPTTGTSGTTTGSTSGAGDIYPSQPWAQPLGPIEVVPGITLEASMEDMQGRFNLNWLVATSGGTTGNNGQTTTQPNGTLTPSNNATSPTIPGLTTQQPDPAAVAAFNKLLELVGIEPKWSDLIIDWIDTDSQPQSQGAEDSAYLGQNPPYLTANRYMTSTTELLALPNFGRENYQKLAPYISALPPGTPLNICTAPAQVLDALTPQTTEWTNDPAGLAKQREATNGCFPDSKTYGASVNAAGGTQGKFTNFGTSSKYFRLTSLITIGTTEFNLYSLLFMDDNGHFIHPVQRSFSPD
jgi:general secretion pathway protein K